MTVDPADAIDAKTTDSLRNAMELVKAFFPDKAMGIGDTWEIKGEAVARMFQMHEAKGSFRLAAETG